MAVNEGNKGMKRLFLQVSTPSSLTRKSQDQWDRYLNGVEDNATRRRRGMRNIFAWQGVENSR